MLTSRAQKILVTHLVCEDPNRNTKGSRQTKIGNFDNSIASNQEILWFQISVQGAANMAVQDTLEDLVEVTFHYGGA